MLFDYNHDTEVKDLKTKRFLVRDSQLWGIHHNPDNVCYCVKEGDERQYCDADGILDISQCPSRYSAPVLISQPHFLDGSPELRERFPDLHPDPTIHETFLDIEPKTGMVLNAAKRIQANVEVFKGTLGKMKDVVDHMVFPLAWVEEAAAVDDDNANKLKTQIFNVIRLANGLCIAAIVVGAFLILIGAGLAILKRDQLFGTSV